jgi:glycosyltransferase involved in cell wall biosynthesis
MKINFVSRYFNTNNAGIGRISEDIYTYFKNKGYNVVKTECMFKSRNQVYYIYYILHTAFKKEKSDIYFALSPLESIFLPSKKSIVLIHDLIPSISGSFFEKKIFNYAIAKTINFKKIICISEEVKEEYLKTTNCDPGKVVLIENWVNPKYTYFEPNNRKKIIIGTISAHFPRKRIDWLIKNFKTIKDDELELHIGGDGPQTNYLKKISKYDNRIKFLGKIPEEKMVTFYKTIDIFVFPSKIEGFGLPIVEAASCGRPVLTLEDSKIPKNVKEKTIQINEYNFKKNINELKNYELRKKLGLKGNKDVECFKYHKILKEYEKIVMDVLNER